MTHTLIQHDALFGGVPLLLRMGIIGAILGFFGYKISGKPGAIISVLFVVALTVGVPMGHTTDQKAKIMEYIFMVTLILMVLADWTPANRARRRR